MMMVLISWMPAAAAVASAKTTAPLLLAAGPWRLPGRPPTFPPTGSKRAFATAMKAKKDQGPTLFQSSDAWQEELEACEKALRLKYKLPATAEADVTDADGAVSLQDAIVAKLTEEWAKFDKIRKEELSMMEYVNGVPTRVPNPKYGDALEVKHAAERYRFWPKQKASLPLLYAAASMLLGVRLTSTANESFHSVAAYLQSRLRSRMTGKNVEMLALAKKFTMDAIKQDAELKALQEEADTQGWVDDDALDALEGRAIEVVDAEEDAGPIA